MPLIYMVIFWFLYYSTPLYMFVPFKIFFTSHYVFRWRNAMNDFYTERWIKVRNIEGASQRIQEDTMRFASIMKGLGVYMVDL